MLSLRLVALSIIAALLSIQSVDSTITVGFQFPDWCKFESEVAYLTSKMTGQGKVTWNRLYNKLASDVNAALIPAIQQLKRDILYAYDMVMVGNNGVVRFLLKKN